jgi:hypothetical protein
VEELATDEWIDQSWGMNGDVIVTDVKSSEEKMTRMMDIYNQTDVWTGER